MGSVPQPGPILTWQELTAYGGCTCPVELAGMAVTAERACPVHGDPRVLRDIRCASLPSDHQPWECE